MKTLEFMVDTVVIGNDTELPDKERKDIFSNNLMLGLQSIEERGISSGDTRILNKIIDKVDSASGKTIELEDAEFNLVKKAFDKGKFDPRLCRVIAQILDFIDDSELKEKAKKKK